MICPDESICMAKLLRICRITKTAMIACRNRR